MHVKDTGFLLLYPGAGFPGKDPVFPRVLFEIARFSGLLGL
jgi:hypothetical protein